MLRLKTQSKRLLTVAGIIGCVFLVAVIMMSLNGDNKAISSVDAIKDTNKIVAEKITDNPPTIKPDAATPNVKEDENSKAVVPTDKTNVVVPLTEVKDKKPTPPPTPQVKHDIEEKADKNVKPTSTPQKQKVKEASKPSAGETNNKGQSFVPGFGWIDSSGANQGGVSADMHENGNKIGKMD